jgi:hypothetical protein
METKLTNKEVILLYNKLNSLTNVPTFALNKAINGNLRQIRQFAKDSQIDKAVTKTPEYVTYEKELEEGYKKLATPTGFDVPKTKIVSTQRGDVTVMDFDPNSQEATNFRLTIESKYQNVLKQREVELLNYSKWLNEECTEDFKLQYITESDMPKDDGNYKELWDALIDLIQ